MRRAAKLLGCFGEDVHIGRFAGFALFLRPGLNSNAEIVVRGKNSYSARVTDTALGTIRSLETTIHGFEERATTMEADILDCHKRAKELEGKIGAPFEHEKRYQQLTRRQGEIEEKLDLTKNQAPSQADAEPAENNVEQNSEAQELRETAKPKRRIRMNV